MSILGTAVAFGSGRNPGGTGRGRVVNHFQVWMQRVRELEPLVSKATAFPTMPYLNISGPGWYGHVHYSARRRRCVECDRLCDACDRALCPGCSRRVGELDFCSLHPIEPEPHDVFSEDRPV